MPTCPWSSHPSKITPATSASGFLLQDLRRVGGRAPSSLSKSHLPHCLLGSLTPSERRFRLSPLTAGAEGSEEGRISKTRRRIIVHWAMKRMSKSCAPFFIYLILINRFYKVESNTHQHENVYIQKQNIIYKKHSDEVEKQGGHL